MRTLLAHWPHVVPALAAFAAVLYLYRANRQWPAADATPARRLPAGRAGAPGPVRREAARRGTIVLTPAVAAAASGAALYGVSLAGARQAEGFVLVHVGLSVLVCLLAVYKLADTDRVRLRLSLKLGRVLQIGGSLLLAVLLAPLLLSGVALLAGPRGGSFASYIHLIAGVWWTFLLVWHIGRYAARSLRTLRSSAGRPAPL